MKIKSKYHYEIGQFRTEEDLVDHFNKIYKLEKYVTPIILLTNNQLIQDAYRKLLENKWQSKTRY